MLSKGIKYQITTIFLGLLHLACFAQPKVTETIQDTIVTDLVFSAPEISNPEHSASFIVSDIVITGDIKTKPYIIEREIPFKRGDLITLNQLVKEFEVARRQLMNTRLFNDVVVSLKSFHGNLVEVQVDVKERWYLFPIPYFKLIDRNLSEWKKQGYGLQRANYGAKLSYYNFTGRNDKLKAWFITGYTRRLEFSYEQPYADKSLKHGYGIGVSYATAKELNYITKDNEQKFAPLFNNVVTLDTSSRNLFNGQVLNELANLSLSYTYRPAIKTRHSVRFNLNYNRIDKAVAILNPKFFNNGNTKIIYPELTYSIDYNNIDFVSYPLKGFLGEASLSRKGINSDMNLWQLEARGTRGWEIAKKTYFGMQGYFVLKLPFDQPYYNQRMFGYGDMYLRGLENYVIDGVAAAMVRNTIRREVLSFDMPFITKAHSKIPFKIYLKAYGDMGYSHNKNFPENSLVNRMLYTCGAGLDIVTLYDVAFRFEYSFNQLGQKGLFLHFKNDF
jgi:outer membrane protein assembly factor BamA